MTQMIKNLKLFLWLTFITGIVYPLTITLIAQVLMPQKANGNFIEINGKIVGADRIAQKFTDAKYFWPRPSATNYSAMPSGGSNLGPTSEKLKHQIEERKAHLLLANQANPEQAVPTELLFASGSGLDPDISLAAAEYQIPRIIQARNWPQEANKAIKDIINVNTRGRSYPLFSQRYVNVLRLNIALDELKLN